MIKISRCVALMFATLVVGPTPPAALAQSIADPLSDLNACRTLNDPTARVGCYDKAVDALNGATARKDVVIVSKAQVKESRKGLFGFNIGKLPIFGGSKDDGDSTEETSITSTVVSARELGHGQWRFKIDGGALWETTEALQGMKDPKTGMAVELKKGAVGSYFVKFNNGRATRAKRVN